MLPQSKHSQQQHNLLVEEEHQEQSDNGKFEWTSGLKFGNMVEQYSFEYNKRWAPMDA